MIELNEHRIRTGLLASDDKLGRTGAFQIGDLTVIGFFPSNGWEHVIVMRQNRTPTWEEMCSIKDLFWKPEDVVIQYHPAKTEYTNVHPFGLHLWRKLGFEMPMPPSIFAQEITYG